jgi:hypothetical protein
MRNNKRIGRQIIHFDMARLVRAKTVVKRRQPDPGLDLDG